MKITSKINFQKNHFLFDFYNTLHLKGRNLSVTLVLMGAPIISTIPEVTGSPDSSAKKTIEKVKLSESGTQC